MNVRRISNRREFLRIVGLGSIGTAILAACGQGTAPAATSAPAKPTEAPKAAATAAPAKPAETSKPGAAAVATSAPASGQVVELRVHDWQQDPDDKFYGPWLKAWDEKHPNIKIKREWFPRSDMHTKQLALAATGQIGDIVRANVAPMTAELRAKEVIQPLDPFIKADKEWAENDHKQFWPGNIATYTIQGQQWAYPVVGHPGCLHYYYNIDHLTAMKAPMPPVDLEKKTFDSSKWKMEDMLTLVKAAQKVGSDGRVTTYGIQPCLGGEGTVAVLRAFGGNYYSDDGTKCLINTPESIAGLEWLSDYYNKHKVAIPVETNPNYQQTFPGGLVAVVVLTAVAGTIKNVVGDKFKWAVVPPPIGPIGKYATQVSSDGICISKITKHPQEAWEYLKYHESKDTGVMRHIAGLGSPGSRYDVWTDQRFRDFQPLLSSIIYDALINPNSAPPLQPWSYPVNGRYNEADTAMTNILQEVWLGKKSPKEAANEAYKTVQAIMDKPAA